MGNGKGSYLHALDLEFHVVLSGSLPILPLLPKVTILPVFHLLTIVEDDGAILRPGNGGGRLEFYEQSPGFVTLHTGELSHLVFGAQDSHSSCFSKVIR